MNDIQFGAVLSDYKYSLSEVAIIGDQIMTDIYGGNNMGIFTVLVNPISNKEPIGTKINRVFEKIIIKKMKKKGIFDRNKYYE